MTSVASGSRLLIHGAEAVVLRTLRPVQLEGGWSVAVLGDVAALLAAELAPGPVVAEFSTDHGPLRLDAEIVQGEGSFLLRAPGLRTAAMVEQRREDVRALVRLPLRGTVLSAVATRSQATEDIDARSAETAGVMLAGTTETVSGGGISVELPDQPGVTPGMTIYVELVMPGGDLAPAVLTVIDHDGPTVRARFVDISPLDRERLVRLVFTRQRADLAERRHDLESAR
jgi:hypothetical protein